MKSKSLPFDHNCILLMEQFHKQMLVYYADGHVEVVDVCFKDINTLYRLGTGYKRPVFFGGCCLYPTHNVKNMKCCFLNVEAFDKHIGMILLLLKERGLDKRALKIYQDVMMEKLKETIK